MSASQVAITPTNPNGATHLWDLWGTGALTGGVGGWETLDRARQLQLTEWVQTPPYTQQITLVCSGMDVSPPRIIDGDVALLRSYGRGDGKGGAPPLLVLSGPIELPAPWTRWALTDVSPAGGTDAPEEIRDDSARLLQQSLTLTLLEATLAPILLGPAAAARARAGKT